MNDPAKRRPGVRRPYVILALIGVAIVIGATIFTWNMPSAPTPRETAREHVGA